MAPVDARFQARFATMQQRLGSPGEGGAGPAADGAAARVAQVSCCCILHSQAQTEALWVRPGPGAMVSIHVCYCWDGGRALPGGVLRL
jgi:hypothetical protein